MTMITVNIKNSKSTKQINAIINKTLQDIKRNLKTVSIDKNYPVSSLKDFIQDEIDDIDYNVNKMNCHLTDMTDNS